jgi:plastocyanin
MTSGSFTFDKAGSFPYRFTIHPSMTATIQVS